MNYWDRVIQFHDSAHVKHANGIPGFAAVQYLRSVFEEFTHHFTTNHPIVMRLPAAYVENYAWLIQFARKIQLLRTIEGSDSLIPRLCKADEVYQTMAEMEIALKLKLAGLDVLFVTPTAQHRTPDMIVHYDAFPINIEVTTVNDPQENTYLDELYLRI